MLNTVVVTSAVMQGLMAVFVYRKKRRSIPNIAIAVLMLASLSLAVTIYAYGLHAASDSSMSLARLTLLFVVIQNTAFYIFSNNYPSSKLTIPKKRLAVFLLISLGIAAAMLNPSVFNSVPIIDNQVSLNQGPLVALFIAHTLFSLVSGFRALVVKRRQAQSSHRNQLNILLTLFILNWMLVLMTAISVILALQLTTFAEVFPFYSLIFGAGIAYTMLASKLFDIRAFTSRSATYLLIVLSVTVVYGAVLYGITYLAFQGKESEFTRELISIAIVIPLILSFQNIKNFFYRDSYDARDVINRVNSVLVGTTELKTLLDLTATVVQIELGVAFADFYVDSQSSAELRHVGTNTKFLNNLDWEEFEELCIASEKSTIVALDESLPKGLRASMRKLNVEVAVKMVSSGQYIGLFVSSERKSGIQYSHQDIQLLETIVNSVAVAAQNALRFEEIAQLNRTLQKKVDDATIKLIRTNEKLKALDEAKDDFISMASHQLRTPLTSVKGYISMILEGDVGKVSDQQRLFLEQAFMSSQRMVYLIADLLNVSRLKTGKFVIEPRPTYLPDVIESEISQLYEAAKARELRLVFNKPSAFPTLNLDETKVRQVIMNFTDNAIYYTSKGGKIIIDLKSTKDSIEFTVRDTGMGVPKSEQPHLFTKFYRTVNAKKARPDGTGLGLFMAKKVIVAQGGAIVFNSEVGAGSTFGFTFPLAKLEALTL